MLREREKEIILAFNCTQLLRGLSSLVRRKFSLVNSFEQNYKLKEVDSSLRDGFCSIDQFGFHWKKGENPGNFERSGSINELESRRLEFN